MTYKQYLAYIEDYKELGSAEQLLGQIGFPPDMTLTAEGLIAATNIIAAVAETDIKHLVSLSGLSMRSFAAKYMIPYRSLQNWCAEIRKPPEYLPILIGWEMITELPKEMGAEYGDIS